MNSLQFKRRLIIASGILVALIILASIGYMDTWQANSEIELSGKVSNNALKFMQHIVQQAALILKLI
ncbi:MAG TPA: hypothetical protein PKC24_05170 [Cyclobacteriaceae bacterium]|nr:hypothetical protein [Cyclobacteriaceae bacterium]